MHIPPNEPTPPTDLEADVVLPELTTPCPDLKIGATSSKPRQQICAERFELAPYFVRSCKGMVCSKCADRLIVRRPGEVNFNAWMAAREVKRRRKPQPTVAELRAQLPPPPAIGDLVEGLDDTRSVQVIGVLVEILSMYERRARIRLRRGANPGHARVDLDTCRVLQRAGER